MKKFLKKIIPALVIAASLFGGAVAANAATTGGIGTPSLWQLIGNQIYTNPTGASIVVGSCAGCGGGSDPVYGSPIIGGTPDEVLFADSGTLLAQSPNFKWDGSTLQLTNPGGTGVPMFKTISSLSENIFQLWDRGRATLDNHSSGGAGLTITDHTTGAQPALVTYGKTVLNNMGTTALQIADGSEGAGKILTSDSSGNASWQTAAGGGGSPGGAIHDIQTNDGSGGFAGDGNFTYDPSTGTILGMSSGNGTFRIDPTFSIFGGGLFNLGFYTGGGQGSNIGVNDSIGTFKYQTGSGDRLLVSPQFSNTGDLDVWNTGMRSVLDVNNSLFSVEDTIPVNSLTAHGGGGVDDIVITGTYTGSRRIGPVGYTITVLSNTTQHVQLGSIVSGPVNIGDVLTTNTAQTGTVFGINGPFYYVDVTLGDNFSGSTTFTSSGGASGSIVNVFTSPSDGGTFTSDNGPQTGYWVGNSFDGIDGIFGQSMAATGRTIGDQWFMTVTMTDNPTLLIDNANDTYKVGDTTLLKSGNLLSINGTNNIISLGKNSSLTPFLDGIDIYTQGSTVTNFANGLTIDLSDPTNYTETYLGNADRFNHLKLDTYEDISGYEYFAFYSQNDTYLQVDVEPGSNKQATFGFSNTSTSHGTLLVQDDFIRNQYMQSMVYALAPTSYGGTIGLNDVLIVGNYTGPGSIFLNYQVSVQTNAGVDLFLTPSTLTIATGDILLGDNGSTGTVLGVTQFGNWLIDVSFGNFSTDTTYSITGGPDAGGTGTTSLASLGGLQDGFSFSNGGGTTFWGVFGVDTPAIDGISFTVGASTGHTPGDYWNALLSDTIENGLSLDYANGTFELGYGTKISIDVINQLVTITNVPAFANDAAAVTGGLTTGQLYKTTTIGTTALNIVP